jgi:Protein phosphatase 2C
MGCISLQARLPHHWSLGLPTCCRAASRSLAHSVRALCSPIPMWCAEGYTGPAAGCTAVVAVIHGNKLYVANAGDSRCVLCRGKETVSLTEDHKPTNPDEERRIKAAGGFVSEGRINGGLNLSRAIGDMNYKTVSLFVTVASISARKLGCIWQPSLWGFCHPRLRGPASCSLGLSARPTLSYLLHKSGWEQCVLQGRDEPCPERCM